MEKVRAVAITGATCSGKSSLAMELAQRLPAEIIAMDSMQIYRRMDIGTDKPTAAQRSKVPHHMLDIVEPVDHFTVAQYCERVLPVLRQVRERGHLPILVGGTGLYLKALMDGMGLGGVGDDAGLRSELTALSLEEGGKERLHSRLAAVDPVSAQKLHCNDVRRVIRAIEIYELTGEPASQSANKTGGGEAEILPIALHMDRPLLRIRLSERIDSMLQRGLAEEVRGLLQSGVTPEMQSMQAIGYKQMVPYLRGESSLEEARRQMVLATRHYAKRQETFLRPDERIRRVETGEGLPDTVMAMIRPFMENRQ